MLIAIYHHILIFKSHFFRATPLQNVTLSVPVDGVVQDMVSQPKGNHLTLLTLSC